MQDLAIKKDLFLHDPAKFLQDLNRFPAVAIKKDLFWHNLAGSRSIILSGRNTLLVHLLQLQNFGAKEYL